MFLRTQSLFPRIKFTAGCPAEVTSCVAGRPCRDRAPWGCSFAQDLSLRWPREARSPPGALAQISMTTDLGWRPGMLSARRSRWKKKKYGGGRAAGEEVKGQLAAPSIILKFEFTGSMCWGF